MPESTLTTQQPGQPPETRPVPPSWATVAPLLDQYKIALLPRKDGLWDLRPFLRRDQAQAPQMSGVPFADLPRTIATLAERCARPEARRHHRPARRAGEGGG